MRNLVAENLLLKSLSELPDWTRSANSIQSTFTFQSFRHSIAFVNKVADLAEEMDHHPEIEVHYKSVRLSLTTHSAGGLTMLDINEARRVSEIYLA